MVSCGHLLIIFTTTRAAYPHTQLHVPPKIDMLMHPKEVTTLGEHKQWLLKMQATAYEATSTCTVGVRSPSI